MTNEEAKAIILKEYLCVDRDCDIEKNCGKCDLMMPSKEPILEAYSMAIKALEVEPKTGRWIAYEVRLPDRTILNYRCSVCGRKLIGYSTETLSEAPFCHCGAKMQDG